MERILFGEDYCDKFNPQDFLQAYYSTTNLNPVHLFRLKELHEFYHSYPSTAKLKILDIGSGPAIANTISAAPYAAEIVTLSTLRQTVQHCCSGSTMIRRLLTGHTSSNML